MAVRWLAVPHFRRKTVDFLLAASRLQINELHLGLKASALFLQVLVLKLLLFELTNSQHSHTDVECAPIRSNNVTLVTEGLGREKIGKNGGKMRRSESQRETGMYKQ